MKTTTTMTAPMSVCAGNQELNSVLSSQSLLSRRERIALEVIYHHPAKKLVFETYSRTNAAMAQKYLDFIASNPWARYIKWDNEKSKFVSWIKIRTNIPFCNLTLPLLIFCSIFKRFFITFKPCKILWSVQKSSSHEHLYKIGNRINNINPDCSEPGNHDFPKLDFFIRFQCYCPFRKKWA